MVIGSLRSTSTHRHIDTTRVRKRQYRTLKIELDNSGGLVAGDLENNGNYPTFSVDKSKGTARSAYRHVRTERVPRALRVRKRTGIWTHSYWPTLFWRGNKMLHSFPFLSKEEFLFIFLVCFFSQITRKIHVLICGRGQRPFIQSQCSV